MTRFLLGFFVKNYENPSDPRVRSRIGSLSGYTGICCNLLLFAGKLTAALLSGSVAILADAWNNLSDASGSIVTLLGFRLADKPADSHHPFGHARFEYLSGLAVSAMILAIGFELGKSSLEKIFHPAPIAFTWLTALILAASIGVKFWLFLFNRRLSRMIGSGTLEAVAHDSRNDCIATGAVLLSGILEKSVSFPLDGWMGLAVAAFILISGWNGARQTISPLLGESADPELRRQLAAFVTTQPGVLGWHDLMVHDYGPGRRFATLHVEMDRTEDPLVCHTLIDDMERRCLRDFNVHLVIHYDPIVTDDPELKKMRRLVSSILQVRHEGISIHDFRMIPEADCIRLVFDAAIPESLQGKEAELQSALESALNRLGTGTYRTDITFDPLDDHR